MIDHGALGGHRGTASLSSRRRHVLQRHAGGAERTSDRFPELEIPTGRRLHRDPCTREEAGAGGAEHEQRSGHDAGRAVSLKVEVRAPQRRSRAHYVVNDRQPLARNPSRQRRRNPVPGIVEAARVTRHLALREIEFGGEPLRQELREECPAEQRAADTGHFVRANRFGETSDERLDRARVGEQGPEVKPESAVMARLEAEVPLAAANQIEKVDGRIPGQRLLLSPGTTTTPGAARPPPARRRRRGKSALRRRPCNRPG